MWRIRISNWLCSRPVVKSSACTEREREQDVWGGGKGRVRPRMRNRHDLNEFTSNALRILLLNELGEDAFEIRELQRSFELGGGSVGQNSTSRDDNDTVADELNYLKNVRDIK